jgi:hypothetical protein
VPLKLTLVAPELRTLDLIKCPDGEGHEGRRLILNTMPWKLEKLSVTGYGGWEQEEFMNMCSLCSDLKVLEMTDAWGVCKIDPSWLVKTCNRLEKLKIHASLITSDCTALATGEAESPLHFENLKSLEVQVRDEVEVDLCGVLATLCPALRSLEVQILDTYGDDPKQGVQAEELARCLGAAVKKTRPDLKVGIKVGELLQLL